VPSIPTGNKMLLLSAEEEDQNLGVNEQPLAITGGTDTLAGISSPGQLALENAASTVGEKDVLAKP
jgi:hypothetical protein